MRGLDVVLDRVGVGQSILNSLNRVRISHDCRFWLDHR